MYTVEDQRELEKYYKDYAEQLLRNSLDSARADGGYARTAVGKGIMKHLVKTFKSNVSESVAYSLKGKKGVKPKYNEILSRYAKFYGEDDMETFYMLLVTETLKVVVNSLVSKKFIMSDMANLIGAELEDEVSLYVFMKTEKDAPKRYAKQLDSRVGRNFKLRFMERAYQGSHFTFPQFPKADKAALGMHLLEILAESTDFFEVGAVGDKNLLELYPSDTFMRAIEKSEGGLIERAVKYVPTIIPPKPWTDMFTGGYYGVLSSKVNFMRHHPYTKNTHTMRRYLARLNELDLAPVYAAVNRIQATPYRVNKFILDVMSDLITQGGGRAGLAETAPIPQLPPFPYDAEDIESSEELKEQFKAHKKKMQEIIKAENSRKGRALRCVMIHKLAKDFSRYDEIYFPMNIDFRGRVYPIPTGLNPQGDDMTKGLLEYAHPAPAQDPSDLDWLAIHGAGLAGHDKIPLADRVQWVKDNEGNILASAYDPLGFTWWQEQDKPFQFLAWCREWGATLEWVHDHGNIVGYTCRCFIAYDGTCSGLQHYSCLLRDPVGGSSVNLIDHDKPADIYNEVAQKVLKMVEQDSKEGTLIGKIGKNGKPAPGTKALAEAWLSYGITRKVCKRPVMTLAYGSGQYGFGNQIFEDTTNGNPHFAAIGAMSSAQYLATKIWKAVKTTVKAATTGMEYLKAVAGMLAKEGYPVEWVTPLGLPIQQMYLELGTTCFRLRFGGASIRYRVYVTEVKEGEEIDRRKQVSGVAPNFIHSLDATHLMMVVNSSDRLITNFTTVHDSFGTSLGEAGHMRRIIREQLVKLYTEHDPLKEFKEHAENMLGREIDDPLLPSKGNLDINSIISSKFVFH